MEREKAFPYFDVKTAPFGSWQSPLTSDLVAAATLALGGMAFDGEDLYWLEGRPAEKGRNVLVRRRPDGTVADVTPPPYNVRTRVHEYGGGAYLVANGTAYFSHFADQRLYRQPPNGDPQPLTPACQRRYADLILDRQRHRLLCVCEDHSRGGREPENTLASVDLAGGEVRTLVSGRDFYSSPRLSPDGSHLAWLTWNHPNLPWDGTQLWLAPLREDGSLGEAAPIAGGEGESICEPKWSPDGQLYFSSDRTGWWNLYRYSPAGGRELLWEMAAEFAYPHWVFGVSTYTFISAQQIACTYTQNGRWTLARLDLQRKRLHPLETPYTSFSSLAAGGEQLAWIGGSPTEATAALLLDWPSGETQILRRSSSLDLDPGYLSQPQALAFPTAGGATAHAWYYPPHNRDFTAPPGELPPLLVKSHGGPTAATSPTLNWRVQYWTSRGFAYLDVNYGGSTGYGRAYRQRLDGNWGIVDVDDCTHAAEYLVRQGKVDGNRLAISGSSAGGYTTLAALTFRETFKAGASYYGISDLEALARDTHKFESRYLHRLVGEYPREKGVYQARSPIHFTERLSCPTIFFQGLDDRVVPPNQAEKMVAALKAKGLPVAYVAFAGEQHGFRRAENIKRALEAEFYFYSRIFGFEPAGAIEPVEIFNLDS